MGKRSSKSGSGKDAAASKKTGGADPFFKGKKQPNGFFHNKALPEELQQNLESSFQQDFSSVAIQKDSQQAKDMKALAFTQGEAIHFAPGQFNTATDAGKSLIGHEFTHIVQQRSGAVKPTGIMRKGIMVNEEKGLEQEADVMGKRAVTGEKIAGYRSVGLGMRRSFSPAQPQMAVVQMAKHPSHYGDWFDDSYAKITSSGQRRGASITMRFKPNANVDAELIGLTQSAQSIHNGSVFYINSDMFYKGHAIQAADAITNPHTGRTDEGTTIDRVKDYNNPIYPVDSLPSSRLDDPSTDPGWGENGWHYTDSANRLQEHDAKLIDAPAIGSVDVRKNSSQVFETAAVATRGKQAGTYYGSVQWGWQTDATGNHTLLPFRVISQGAPSSTFFKAAQIWNAGTSATGAATVDLPIVDVKLISNPAGVSIASGTGTTLLPRGTRVQEIPTRVSLTHTMIRVVDGPFVGQTGWVPNGDLSDERP